jgi:hypothetical protein
MIMDKEEKIVYVVGETGIMHVSRPNCCPVDAAGIKSVPTNVVMHQVIDMTDPASMEVVKAVQLPQGATGTLCARVLSRHCSQPLLLRLDADVEVCGDYVAVAVEGVSKTANGKVIIYEKHTSTRTGPRAAAHSQRHVPVSDDLVLFRTQAWRSCKSSRPARCPT